VITANKISNIFSNCPCNFQCEGCTLEFITCATVQYILISLKISQPGPIHSAGAVELMHKGAAHFQLKGEAQPSHPTISSALWLASARTQERD